MLRAPSVYHISNVLSNYTFVTHDFLIRARALLLAAELLLGHAECLVAVVLLARTLLVRVGVHVEVFVCGYVD
jgi:hypothetical protein